MKLLDFIICDDIRQEIDGKQTIIGVHNELSINRPDKELILPLVLKLAFFTRLLLEADDIMPDKLKLEIYQDNKYTCNFEGDINVTEKVTCLNLMIINNALQINNCDKLTCKYIFFKEQKIIKEIVPEFELRIKYR